MVAFVAVADELRKESERVKRGVYQLKAGATPPASKREEVDHREQGGTEDRLAAIRAAAQRVAAKG